MRCSTRAGSLNHNESLQSQQAASNASDPTKSAALSFCALLFPDNDNVKGWQKGGHLFLRRLYTALIVPISRRASNHLSTCLCALGVYTRQQDLSKLKRYSFMSVCSSVIFETVGISIAKRVCFD